MHQTSGYSLRDARQIIKDLAARHGFKTDRALAAAAGVPQPTLSRYLNGTNATMEVASFSLLAKALNVTLSELLGEVPLSSGGVVREFMAVLDRLPEPEQRALLAAGRAMADSIDSER